MQADNAFHGRPPGAEPVTDASSTAPPPALVGDAREAVDGPVAPDGGRA